MAVSRMNIIMHRMFPHVTGSLAKYDPLELKFGVLKRLARGTTIFWVVSAVRDLIEL